MVGFLYKQRGAVQSPPVSLRDPVRSSLSLFRSRSYVLGIVIATCSWGLHVTALALAPISLVQSVIAGGLVLLTVVADRLFGLEVSRREWLGVAAAAVGLAFLAATIGSTGRNAHNHYHPLVLGAYVVGLARSGRLLSAGAGRRGLAAGHGSGHRGRAAVGRIGRVHQGAFGRPGPVGSRRGRPPAGAGDPGAVSGRSLGVGAIAAGRRRRAVIAVTSAAANLVTIAAGPIVFEEPLPGGATALVVRLAAFILVIVAASLTPAPVRVAPGPDAPQPLSG